MLRSIVLHGKLKELYDKPLKLDVSSVSEAIRGLHQIEGFSEALSQGAYKVCIGEETDEASIDVEILPFQLGKIQTIHLIPVMAGEKGGGGKIILGVAMLAMAYFTAGSSLAIGADANGIVWGDATGVTAFGLNVTSGTIAKLGLALVLGGITNILTPHVQGLSSNAGGQNNFLFSGPLNTDAQGSPIPLVYGRMLVGSIVVSSGISTVNIVPPAIDPLPPQSEG